jgi:CHASE1-domain containing sensor protein
LRAAFQASEHGISRREFQSFTDHLLRDQTAIFAASWIPRVTRDQRSPHELAAARDGLSGYGIKSVAADGSLSPAEEASEYFPIFYSSIGIPDSSFYGIDLNDGGIRQRTLERARDEDRAAASPSFVLRRVGGDRNGFLAVTPDACGCATNNSAKSIAPSTPPTRACWSRTHASIRLSTTWRKVCASSTEHSA